MAPNTIDNPQPYLILSLILIVTIFSPTLKFLGSRKGKTIYNPTHTPSANGMKITTIGKDSVTVSIMEISLLTP